MMRPGTTPMTGTAAPRPGTAKSSGVTDRAFMLSRPIGEMVARAAKSASSTTRPAEITVETLQLSKASISTISARRPGAIIPRSKSPKARAAVKEADR